MISGQVIEVMAAWVSSEIDRIEKLPTRYKIARESRRNGSKAE